MDDIMDDINFMIYDIIIVKVWKEKLEGSRTTPHGRPPKLPFVQNVASLGVIL